MSKYGGGGGGEARGRTTGREQTGSGKRTDARRKGRNEFRVGLSEFPRLLTFLPESMRYCLPSGLLAEAGAPGSLAACGEGGLAEGLSVWDLSPPSALSGLSVRGAGTFCLVLDSSWGQNQLETTLEPEEKGALLAQRTQARRKNYIPGRSKYACLEKLLAFMKSLVRKAGLQMTASERQ